MTTFVEWFPWLAIAAIPGLFNIIAAFEELNERCKLLPFFDPIATPGVWVWGTIQFFFPGILFWGTASLGSQPTITLRLLGEAAVFGIGFIAVLNANIRIGTNTIPIKSAYTFFVNIAYRIIAYNQDDRVYEFWLDVQDALETSADMSRGLDFLQEYFEIEVEITQQPLGNFKDELDQIRELSDRPQQARRIKSLLKRVSRKRLQGILRQFQIDRGILQRYFPPQPRRDFFRLRKRRKKTPAK